MATVKQGSITTWSELKSMLSTDMVDKSKLVTNNGSSNAMAGYQLEDGTILFAMQNNGGGSIKTDQDGVPKRCVSYLSTGQQFAFEADIECPVSGESHSETMMLRFSASSAQVGEDKDLSILKRAKNYGEVAKKLADDLDKNPPKARRGGGGVNAVTEGVQANI